MYLITDDEERTVLALCQAYHKLKELGWKDIGDFEPGKDFGFSRIGTISRHRAWQPAACRMRVRSGRGREYPLRRA